MVLNESIRSQLVTLARRGKAHITEFTRDRPTDWRPTQVRNPDGMLDGFFTDASAWEFIAAKLEEGHPVEIVELYKPAGTKGYVMKVDMEPGMPPLYIKLQLGAGKIIGRSFHFSEKLDWGSESERKTT